MRRLTATICLILAVLLGSEGGEIVENQAGAREWKPFAKRGNAAAQYFLGNMFFYDLLKSRAQEEAREYEKTGVKCTHLLPSKDSPLPRTIWV